MRSTLFFAFAAMATRTGLFLTGHHVQAFHFWPVHLLFLVLVTFFVGHFTLREDPETGLAELMRSGMREAAIYALLLGIFIWVFFTFINVNEFPDRIALLVKGLVDSGHTEAEARAKVSGFFTPGTYSFLTFMCLFVGGAINAVFFAFVHDKVLRRFAKR